MKVIWKIGKLIKWAVMFWPVVEAMFSFGQLLKESVSPGSPGGWRLTEGEKAAIAKEMWRVYDRAVSKKKLG